MEAPALFLGLLALDQDKEKGNTSGIWFFQSFHGANPEDSCSWSHGFVEFRNDPWLCWAAPWAVFPFLSPRWELQALFHELFPLWTPTWWIFPVLKGMRICLWSSSGVINGCSGCTGLSCCTCLFPQQNSRELGCALGIDSAWAGISGQSGIYKELLGL